MVFHPEGPARLGDFCTPHFNAGFLFEPEAGGGGDEREKEGPC